MASVHCNVHLRDTDAPFAQRLDSGSVALWLEGPYGGPTLIGSPEALLEVRRAIGRFLFPDEFAKPEEEAARANLEVTEALKAAHHALTTSHNLRATDLTQEIFDAHLGNDVPRDQLEWVIDHSADLEKVEAALANRSEIAAPAEGVAA